MKFLITGCAGFIGFSIAQKILQKKGNFVIGTDILSKYYSVTLKRNRLKILNKNKNFKFKKCDLSEKKDTNKIFNSEKFDVVIHLAAQPGVRRSVKFPYEYYSSNVSSFFNILEYSKKYKIKKILFASSSSVYGDNKTFPIKEDFKRNPKNFYALTKCINEDMGKFYSEKYNMSIIGLRFFTVYGPYGRPDMLIWKLCENILQNKVLSINNYGNHERDFTFIDDATEMISKLVKLNKPKLFDIYNICSNNPVKLKHILKIFDKYRNNKIKKNLKFQEFQTGDVIKTHGSNKKIINQIKFTKKTTIEKGILKTIKWFKEYHSL